MRHLLLLLCAGSAVAGTGPLAEHRWKHRVLVLQAPAGDPAVLERFRDRVRQRQCGIDDRDLVTGELVGRDAGRLGDALLDADGARALRRHLNVDAGEASTVLVGKDGGVKMRVSGVADLDRVFARIDGMPMRRREMAEHGPPDCNRGTSRGAAS